MKRENLSVEQLERRALLAGLVTAEIIDRELQITGDEQSNGIQIEQRGLNVIRFVPDSTTSVNGMKAGEPVELRGFPQRVEVEMGPGNDSLSFQGSPLSPQAMKINTGPGADKLQLSKMNVLGGVNIFNPAGTDAIEIADSRIVGTLSVKHGDPQSNPTLEDDPPRNGMSTPSSFSISNSQTGKVSVESEGIPMTFPMILRLRLDCREYAEKCARIVGQFVMNGRGLARHLEKVYFSLARR